MCGIQIQYRVVKDAATITQPRPSIPAARYALLRAVPIQPASASNILALTSTFFRPERAGS
jgi:hypothetical protein